MVLIRGVLGTELWECWWETHKRLECLGCSNTAPSGLSVPCSPTLPHVRDIRGGTEPFWCLNPHLGVSDFTLTHSLAEQNRFSSRNIKAAWQRWEGRQEWGGDVSLEGTWAQSCSLLTILPVKTSLLEPAAFPALWAGQPQRLGKKGGRCPNFPNATNNSYSFKAFHPLLDWGRGRGDGGWESRTAPLSHSPRFDSLYEHDPPIRNQGLISQLTASSSIISIQTN